MLLIEPGALAATLHVPQAISAAPKRQRTHVLQENMGTR